MKILHAASICALYASLISGAFAQVQTYTGTSGQDVFPGSLTGEADYFGLAEYDQIDYEGSATDYTFETQANGQIHSVKANGGYDILDSIEGIWFLGEENWYSVGTLVNSPPTDPSHQFGLDENGTPYCSDNYEGPNTQGYGWEDTDADGEDNSCRIQDEDSSSSTGSQLTHFGQDIILNGANVAWVDYGADVGNEISNAIPLQSKFAQIKAAGGNSTRVWIHASGWHTPAISTTGYVEGISTRTADGITDQQVNEQVTEILDAAWDEGIVVNLVLFSFEMMCDSANIENGAKHKGERFNQMINVNYQSYFDNVLDPLVRKTKDHPALFSYEIFNEADGMAIDTHYFESNCPQGSYPQSQYTLQRFVNLASAEIKSIDSNVKVTSSVSRTARLGQYTNAELTGKDFSDSSGTLDYYQAHWYWVHQHGDNPYINNAEDRGLDKPILIGEIGDGVEPESNTATTDLAKNLIEQGYAGVWVWDQNYLSQGQVDTIVSGASSYSPSIDKAAVEACISSQYPNCYSQ